MYLKDFFLVLEVDVFGLFDYMVYVMFGLDVLIDVEVMGVFFD